MKIEITESELEDIIYCLDLRSQSSEVAKEYREIYKKLADKLEKKMG